MPVSLPQLLGGGEGDGVTSGVRQELDRMIHPKVAQVIGLATGLTILVVGYGVRARRRRLDRLESKLDVVVEDIESDLLTAAATAAHTRRPGEAAELPRRP